MLQGDPSADEVSVGDVGSSAAVGRYEASDKRIDDDDYLGGKAWHEADNGRWVMLGLCDIKTLAYDDQSNPEDDHDSSFYGDRPDDRR